MAIETRTLEISDPQHPDALWLGTLSTETNDRLSIKFKVFQSAADAHGVGFKEGFSRRKIVTGWLDMNVPITLGEILVTGIGGGALSKGYRYRGYRGGTARYLIEGVHIHHQTPRCISAIHIRSSSVDQICWPSLDVSIEKTEFPLPHRKLQLIASSPENTNLVTRTIKAERKGNARLSYEKPVSLSFAIDDMFNVLRVCDVLAGGPSSESSFAVEIVGHDRVLDFQLAGYANGESHDNGIFSFFPLRGQLERVSAGLCSTPDVVQWCKILVGSYLGSQNIDYLVRAFLPIVEELVRASCMETQAWGLRNSQYLADREAAWTHLKEIDRDLARRIDRVLPRRLRHEVSFREALDAYVGDADDELSISESDIDSIVKVRNDLFHRSNEKASLFQVQLHYRVLTICRAIVLHRIARTFGCGLYDLRWDTFSFPDLWQQGVISRERIIADRPIRRDIP